MEKILLNDYDFEYIRKYCCPIITFILFLLRTGKMKNNNN